MRSLYELMHNDPLVQRRRMDMALTEEQYRYLVQAAAEVFREESLRLNGAVHVTHVPNGSGVIKSRKLKVVDVGDAIDGPGGVGGGFDRIDQAFDDQTVWRIWKNWEIPILELKASQRGGLDVLQQTGRAIGEKIALRENKFIVDGLGPVKGITQATGIQTFAGASWTSTAVAFDDIVKALDDKLATEGAPRSQAAMLVNHAEFAKLRKKNVGTANFGVSFDEIKSLLPGGIHPNSNIDAGKAYVYAKTPTVIDYEVFEDLSVIPLPSVDEDPRGRQRLSVALHIARPLGICEITGIA